MIREHKQLLKCSNTKQHEYILDLSQNSIGEKGAIAIDEMLKCCNYNSDRRSSVVRALTAKVGGLGFNPQWLYIYTPMHFGHPDLLPVAYHRTTSYCKIIMRMNSIGERGATAMAEMLSHTQY